MPIGCQMGTQSSTLYIELDSGANWEPIVSHLGATLKQYEVTWASFGHLWDTFWLHLAPYVEPSG